MLKLKQASVRTALCVARVPYVSQYVFPPPAFLLLLLQLHCRQATILLFFFLIFSQVFDRGERKEMNTDRQASIPVPDDGTSSKQTPCGSAETKTVLHRTGHYSFYILE